MAEEISYPERYCAYIDILGFRGLVTGLGEDNSKVKALADILSRVHRPLRAGFANWAAIHYRTQSISDAVAISVTPNLEGLHELFSIIHDLALDL
jgi:hypothetical protein